MATNPEALLISAVIKEQDHVTAAANGVTKDLFHAFLDEWVFIEDYIRVHRRTPSRDAFLNRFPSFRIKKVTDVEHFAGEVRKSHIRISATQAVNDIILSIENDDLGKALRTMHTSAINIQGQLGGMGGDEDIFEHYDDVLAEVEARVKRAEDAGQAGVPTGFPTLDQRTGGPQAGHMWVVAARLGQGKTWSLIRMACAAAFSGYNVQYIALEGTRSEIAMRVHTFASSEFGKDVFRNIDLQQGKNFSMRDYKEFLNGLSTHIHGKFYIADASRGRIGVSTIAAIIEKNKPDIVYIDYITLVEKNEGNNDWRSIADLSAGIKQLATLYQIPIVCAAQLNRNAADRSKEPSGTENLAESDAIARDADAVITMKQASKRAIVMKLVKYRHGRDGYMWWLKFLPNTGHFEEITSDEALDIQSEDKDDDEEGQPAFKPRQKGSFSKISETRVTKPGSSRPGTKRVIRRAK